MLSLVLVCELCRQSQIEIVIVTLHPFGCCSTIKFTLSVSFQTQNLSVALLHLLIHCSVFKVQIHFQPRLKPDLKVQSLGFEIQQQIAVWWARVGSNHRPYDYQSYALAS